MEHSPQPPKHLKQSPEARASHEAATLEEITEQLTEAPALEGSEQDFTHNRLQVIANVWRKSKGLYGKVADNLSIEHEGYRLTAGENIKARLGRFAMLGSKSFGEHGISDAENPFVQRATQRAKQRQHIRQVRQLRRDTPYKDPDLSGHELVKAGAYELLTLSPLRGMGLMALRGASEAVEKRASGRTQVFAEKASRVASRRIKIHEKGLHNPYVRVKHGYNTREYRQHLKTDQ